MRRRSCQAAIESWTASRSRAVVRWIWWRVEADPFLPPPLRRGWRGRTDIRRDGLGGRVGGLRHWMDEFPDPPADAATVDFDLVAVVLGDLEHLAYFVPKLGPRVLNMDVLANLKGRQVSGMGVMGLAMLFLLLLHQADWRGRLEVGEFLGNVAQALAGLQGEEETTLCSGANVDVGLGLVVLVAQASRQDANAGGWLPIEGEQRWSWWKQVLSVEEVLGDDAGASDADFSPCVGHGHQLAQVHVERSVC